MTNKINVLIYALPNTSSGGLSVVLNLYEDIKKHGESFSDIHWYFIVGTEGFENSDNITIYNEKWALKTYIHRWYYNKVCVRKFVKEHNIKAIISLNTSIKGISIPSIISMHNVLPLYHCGAEVFDNKLDMIKQALRNTMMVSSWKRADYIIVPSKWIKESLQKEFSIPEKKIFISPISTPEIEIMQKNDMGEKIYDGTIRFIYPSSGFPYKNHRVVVDAVKKLVVDGIEDFLVRFTGNVGNGATISEIRKEIHEYKLPIEFSGMISKEELAVAYKYGTLVFPSKIETDGFPLLESMACGGYIIASNSDYAVEALKDYDNYDLFDPDDSEQLAILMRNVIEKKTVGKSKGTVVRSKPRTEIIVPMLRELALR